MTDIDELDYQMGSLVADVLDAAEEWADEAVTPGGGCGGGCGEQPRTKKFLHTIRRVSAKG